MRLIALFCMLLLSSISSASLVIHSVEKKEVLRYAWILDDVGDILTIEQVIETARQNRFVASQTDTLHTQLDLSSKWLRLDVENPTNIQHFVMSLNGLIGGEWQLYRVNGNSSPYESIELLSLEQGDFTHIDMRTGQNLFYLKISPNSPSSISIDLQGQTEYVNAQRNKLLLYGLFVGGLVSLMCLFLVMWWRMRNIGLILPFGYMLMFAVIQNSIVTPYPMLIAPNNAIFITMAMAVSLLASISFIIFKNQISTRWQVVLISSGIVQVFMSIGWAWLPISLKFLGSLVIFANLLLCTLVWLLHYGVKENGQRQIIICWALLTLLTLLELCKLNGFDLWPSLFHLEVMVLSLLHLLLLLLPLLFLLERFFCFFFG